MFVCSVCDVYIDSVTVFYTLWQVPLGFVALTTLLYFETITCKLFTIRLLSDKTYLCK
jgi:hypothetical protein